MKSFVQSCWLMTAAGGNLICVIVASAKFFDKQVNLLAPLVGHNIMRILNIGVARLNKT